MANQRNALRAGVFMIVSLALVIFVIIAISGAGRFTQSFTSYPVVFTLGDDIGGLRVGDDVRVGGLKVGSITNIQIRPIPPNVPDIEPDQAAQPAVIVYIDVPSRYELKRDASVSIQKSITGAAAVNIESLGVKDPLTSADFLRGHPDALSALFHRLGSIEPDLHKIVSNVASASVKLNTDLDKLGNTADAFTETGFTADETVHDLHVRLPDIVAKYNAVTTSAVRMLDVIHDLLGPSTSDFHATMANVHGITGDLHQRLPDLMNQLRTILQKADLSVTRAAAAMQDIQGVSANTKQMTAALRSVVVDNKGKLDSIIAGLKSTSENLKYASQEIRHAPWRLLYQPKPDEVTDLNTYDSVRQFAEGANTLDDAAAALRDALKDPGADPEEVKKLMAHLDESFNRFEMVQDRLWKDIK